MKRLTVLLCGLMIAGLAVACAPIAAPTPEPIPATATPVAEPEIEEPEIEEPEIEEPEVEMPEFDGPLAVVAENVRDYLVTETGASPEEITIVEMEAVDWPDGCLGAAQADEMCIQVITPGYRVIASVDGEEMVLHTNADASVIRPAPNGEVRPAASEAEARGDDIAMTVRQLVMQQLRVDFDAITVTAVEATEWPDACLGAPNPAELCAQMITPGYRVVIEVDGDEYVYHTDETGRSIRLASAPEARTGDPIILWNWNGDECREATIGLDGVAFGGCYAVQMQGYLPGEQREADLAYFASTYAPVSAETPAGHIEFFGTGDQTATADEARMIAEWARLVALEADAGRSGASWGLAFAWYREGGNAGFCDNLGVYVTGYVYAAQCEGESYITIGERRLDAAELAQVYAWIDEYDNFELDETRPAEADAMIIRVVFSGAGATQADAVAQQEIADFAASLFATLE